VSLVISTVFASLAFASPSTTPATKWSAEERETILYTPAYCLFQVTQGKDVPNQDTSNLNQSIEQHYLSLSDDQFQSAMETQLKSVINSGKSGEAIAWNKNFVENTVKSKLPDLYSDISAQESKQTSINGTVSNAMMMSNVTVSSPQTRTFIAHYYGSLGVELCDLDCYVVWWFSNGKVTNVSPSTYGVEKIPFVYYQGLVINQQYSISSSDYHLYKEGKFACGYSGVNVYYYYPWMSVDVYGNGSYFASYSG
jgi:hypothetical protein